MASACMSPATGNGLTVAVGAVSRRGRPRRQYKCQHCAKIFKRSEHCIRHERTHTHEKPFFCRYCHKSYSRKDLVTRHERTLHGHGQDQQQDQQQDSNQGTPPSGHEDPAAADQNLVGFSPSSTTANTSINTQRQPATTHVSPNPATIYPTARDHNSEAIDPNLTTAMAFDDEISLEQAGNGTVSPHHQQDQDPGSFFFSTMPNVDLDFAGTAYSPNLQMMDDFRLHPLPSGDFEEMSNFAYPPAQAIPDFCATESRTAHTDTSKPRDTSAIPLLLQDERPPWPALTLDDATYQSIRSDLTQRLVVPDHEIDIPPAKICQGFLSSYVANFHGHLPIIHLQTLCPETTPSPLMLAMCSIGALYRLDRRRARRLYDTAVRSVEIVARPSQDDDKALVKEYSLWYVQARMLLSFYAIMSGEKDHVFSTMQENGFFTLVFNKARVALEGDRIDLSRMTWHDWVEHESWKRLLGALLVASTLTMVMFDVNPGFNATQDLEFESFHDEALWNAGSPNEWRELRTNSLKQQQNLGRRKLKEVFTDIIRQGKYHPNTAPYQVSAFSALVLMYAVVVHMWQRLQVSQAFDEPWCTSSFSASGGHDPLGPSLLDNAMKSLARCDAFLRSAENGTSQMDPDEATESSLVFNCQAVLRIAYIRLFKPASPSNRINLISMNPVEMEASVTSFVTVKMERSPQLLDAVAKSFEGMRIPVKLGHLLVRKTAAFRWGVEHAIAGWESALLVTKWVHSVELGILNSVQPSSKERELLTLIKEVLEEAEYDLSESVSLAAGLARTWGWFLQDVWIWGITPRMGSALGLLAKAYERVRKANHRHSLDAGS